MQKGRQKVLILGGNGLLGSHCLSTFSKDFETLSTYNSIKIDRKDFIKFSFNSFNSNFLDILGKFKPDYIINTAGLVSVDGCERDELKAMQLNSFFLKRLIHDLNILKLNKTHLIQFAVKRFHIKIVWYNLKSIKFEKFGLQKCFVKKIGRINPISYGGWGGLT